LFLDPFNDALKRSAVLVYSEISENGNIYRTSMEAALAVRTVCLRVEIQIQTSKIKNLGYNNYTIVKYTPARCSVM
jgi:hypothetical protein